MCCLPHTDLNIPTNDTHSPFLAEIARNLWAGRAAVMVGAGFSGNAECADPSIPPFPNWKDLSQSLTDDLADNDKSNGTSDFLQVAEQYEETFGRAALNGKLQQIIPDKSYAPSELHRKLLMLPWRDVFTTNYDTLLERATYGIVDQMYQTVTTQEELVYSNPPRIIKPHGTFPAIRPFIVTEEDYRRYPVTHAPFVNTVQQSHA